MCGRPPSSIAASRAPPPAITTPRGAFDMTTPLVGRGNLANVLAATAVAVEFDVPLEAIAERRATARAGCPPRRDRPAAGRRHDHRRQLQRQSDRDAPGAGRARDATARPPGGWRCSARCSSWANAPPRFTRRWAAPRRGRSVDVLIAVGGGPAAALADGRRRRRHAGRQRPVFRHQRRGRRRRGRRWCAPAIWCWSRVRAACGPIASWNG